MAHYRMVKAIYNPEESSSTVALSSQYGVFEHTVYTHENDKDVENRFDGMNIAEAMCRRDIAKAKMQEMRTRLREAKHIYNVLCHQSDAPFTCDPVADALLRQVDVAERDFDNAKHHYEFINESIANNVHELPNIRRKIRNALECALF